MADMMAVYYKKYEKIFPKTGKLRGFVNKMLILLILELQTLSLQHPSDAIHASFRIWYIPDGVQDGSQQVLQTQGSSALPVGMSEGFVTDHMHYLIEQHFTNSRIWINEHSMRVW